MISIANKAFYLPDEVNKRDAKGIILKQRRHFIVISLVTAFVIAVILGIALSRNYNNPISLILGVVNFSIFLFIGVYFLVSKPNYSKLENIMKTSKDDTIEVKKFVINNGKFVLLEFYSSFSVIIILISFLVIKQV